MKNSTLYSIDRFEGDIAICEAMNGQKKEFPRSALPSEAKETHCIRVYDDGEITIDYDETEQRKQQIIALQKRLFQHKTPE